ncbi:LuxR C-terminal-related transcriptional regulator [Kribbella sp. NPDC049174]|uniref:LuxR C-terminal-related transcriptional regulator n=1 Tax=Kribbella sp. NPDC049174 TaxID=3364112 RepID=UPI0037191BFC
MRSLTPVLETKLYVPRPRAGWVSRPRLRERLGTGSTLTLISAPAGFGKTTLLAAAAENRSVAWLSLDAGDNDPATFWTYVVAALRTVAPEVGALPESSRPVPVASMLTPLLNDLGALGRDIVLVLDDYHHIDAREIQDGMAFLLDRVPPNLRVVIAGRADPLLPLARLRARGELVEIRAADLRFTPAEAATYLNEMMGLQLTARDVAALDERTEGWIAALQLAALSMQGRDDVTAFIDGFAGTDRFVVDYLVEEVVARQPSDIQSFLLQTSVLDRLSGSLCDALTGQVDGKAALAALERGNLFLVPLDDRRQWYRYHHLFADVMHARLLDAQPDQVPLLHRRASAWYEQYGDLPAAIHHALAARDFEHAADLMELAIPAMRRDRQEATMIGWLERLPDELVRGRPRLSVDFAGALLSIGAVDSVESRLQDASHDPQLGGWIAIYRAGLALMRADNAATVTYGRQALDLLPDDDQLGHGAATGLLGLASWAQGDLEAAHTAYTDCMTSLIRVRFLSDALGCAVTLADIAITQGRLREAMRIYQRGLELGKDGPVLRGTADMYVGLSALHRERNELPMALELLQRGKLLGDAMGMPRNPYRSRVAMARIREAEGDLAGAADLLDEAEHLYFGDFAPEVRPISAMKARVWIRQGKVDDGLDWARSRGLPTDLDYLHEFEHITLARALLAQGSLDEALGLLEGLLREAETGGRMGSLIEILVLQALALDLPAGLVPLERALALASPEGYVRVFVDEGPAMLRLLKAAAKQGIAVGQLVSLLTGSTAPSQGLPDALSERELEVLRLLGSELAGPDIARELTVSLNTLRTHTKSIYLKLGVNSRRAAVRRAAELGLLTHSR